MPQSKQDLTLSPKSIILELVNRTNRLRNPDYLDLTLELVTFGTPRAYDGRRNTALTIYAAEGQELGWSERTVYYNRLDLEQLFPEGLELVDANEETTIEDILALAGQLQPVLMDPSDFADIEIEVPGTAVLKALDHSLVYIGETTATLFPKDVVVEPEPEPEESWEHTLETQEEEPLLVGATSTFRYHYDITPGSEPETFYVEFTPNERISFTGVVTSILPEYLTVDKVNDRLMLQFEPTGHQTLQGYVDFEYLVLPPESESADPVARVTGMFVSVMFPTTDVVIEREIEDVVVEEPTPSHNYVSVTDFVVSPDTAIRYPEDSLWADNPQLFSVLTDVVVPTDPMLGMGCGITFAVPRGFESSYVVLNFDNLPAGFAVNSTGDGTVEIYLTEDVVPGMHTLDFTFSVEGPVVLSEDWATDVSASWYTGEGMQDGRYVQLVFREIEVEEPSEEPAEPNLFEHSFNESGDGATYIGERYWVTYNYTFEPSDSVRETSVFFDFNDRAVFTGNVTGDTDGLTITTSAGSNVGTIVFDAGDESVLSGSVNFEFEVLPQGDNGNTSIELTAAGDGEAHWVEWIAFYRYVNGEVPSLTHSIESLDETPLRANDTAYFRYHYDLIPDMTYGQQSVQFNASDRLRFTGALGDGAADYLSTAGDGRNVALFFDTSSSSARLQGYVDIQYTVAAANREDPDLFVAATVFAYNTDIEADELYIERAVEEVEEQPATYFHELTNPSENTEPVTVGETGIVRYAWDYQAAANGDSQIIELEIQNGTFNRSLSEAPSYIHFSRFDANRITIVLYSGEEDQYRSDYVDIEYIATEEPQVTIVAAVSEGIESDVLEHTREVRAAEGFSVSNITLDTENSQIAVDDRILVSLQYTTTGRGPFFFRHYGDGFMYVIDDIPGVEVTGDDRLVFEDSGEPGEHQLDLWLTVHDVSSGGGEGGGYTEGTFRIQWYNAETDEFVEGDFTRPLVRGEEDSRERMTVHSFTVTPGTGTLYNAPEDWENNPQTFTVSATVEIPEQPYFDGEDLIQFTVPANFDHESTSVDMDQIPSVFERNGFEWGSFSIYPSYDFEPGQYTFEFTFTVHQQPILLEGSVSQCVVQWQTSDGSTNDLTHDLVFVEGGESEPEMGDFFVSKRTMGARTMDFQNFSVIEDENVPMLSSPLGVLTSGDNGLIVGLEDRSTEDDYHTECRVSFDAEATWTKLEWPGLKLTGRNVEYFKGYVYFHARTRSDHEGYGLYRFHPEATFPELVADTWNVGLSVRASNDYLYYNQGARIYRSADGIRWTNFDLLSRQHGSGSDYTVLSSAFTILDFFFHDNRLYTLTFQSNTRRHQVGIQPIGRYNAVDRFDINCIGVGEYLGGMANFRIDGNDFDFGIHGDTLFIHVGKMGANYSATPPVALGVLMTTSRHKVFGSYAYDRWDLKLINTGIIDARLIAVDQGMVISGVASTDTAYLTEFGITDPKSLALSTDIGQWENWVYDDDVRILPGEKQDRLYTVEIQRGTETFDTVDIPEFSAELLDYPQMRLASDVANPDAGYSRSIHGGPEGKVLLMQHYYDAEQQNKKTRRTRMLDLTTNTTHDFPWALPTDREVRLVLWTGSHYLLYTTIDDGTNRQDLITDGDSFILLDENGGRELSFTAPVLTRDEGWQHNVEISGMVPSVDGSRLYLHGMFDTVDGQAQRGIVAIDPLTGARQDFDVTAALTAIGSQQRLMRVIPLASGRVLFTLNGEGTHLVENDGTYIKPIATGTHSTNDQRVDWAVELPDGDVVMFWNNVPSGTSGKRFSERYDSTLTTRRAEFPADLNPSVIARNATDDGWSLFPQQAFYPNAGAIRTRPIMNLSDSGLVEDAELGTNLRGNSFSDIVRTVLNGEVVFVLLASGLIQRAHGPRLGRLLNLYQAEYDYSLVAICPSLATVETLPRHSSFVVGEEGALFHQDDGINEPLVIAGMQLLEFNDPHASVDVDWSEKRWIARASRVVNITGLSNWFSIQYPFVTIAGNEPGEYHYPAETLLRLDTQWGQRPLAQYVVLVDSNRGKFIASVVNATPPSLFWTTDTDPSIAIEDADWRGGYQSPELNGAGPFQLRFHLFGVDPQDVSYSLESPIVNRDGWASVDITPEGILTASRIGASWAYGGIRVIAQWNGETIEQYMELFVS